MKRERRGWIREFLRRLGFGNYLTEGGSDNNEWKMSFRFVWGIRWRLVTVI